MLTGGWTNFDELEEALSYPELVAMIKALRDKERRDFEALAAVNGIDLNKDKREDPVERAKRRAAAKQKGVSENEYNLQTAGFSIIEE